MLLLWLRGNDILTLLCPRNLAWTLLSAPSVVVRIGLLFTGSLACFVKRLIMVVLMVLGCVLS